MLYDNEHGIDDSNTNIAIQQQARAVNLDLVVRDDDGDKDLTDHADFLRAKAGLRARRGGKTQQATS